jgi:hypothetical protein
MAVSRMPRKAAEDSVTDRGVDTWVLELDLHPAQKEVWNSPARFKVVAAGRRFGKSLLAAAKCIEKAASKPDAVVMWVSPSHDQSRIGFNMVKRALPRSACEVNKTLSEIYLSTGGTILFRSTERWDNLRGHGLDFVVLDEAAKIEEQAWTAVIRPALADRRGEAMLIGTFNGQNWFYDLWRRAQDPDNKEWAAFKFVTADNPYIDPSEIEEFQRNNPKEVFEQEFMSSPLAYAGAVFDGVRLDEAWEAGKAWTGMPHSIRMQVGSGQQLIKPVTEAGLDWGDFETALMVAFENGETVTWVEERIYQRVELGEKLDDIMQAITYWSIQAIYADAAGATENRALAKRIEDAGIDCIVQPVPFQTYKKSAILTRKWYLEQGLEVVTAGCPGFIMDSKGYHWDPRKGAGDEAPAKSRDHTVDAASAFYAPRSYNVGITEETTSGE